jgi:hypothetical protein
MCPRCQGTVYFEDKGGQEEAKVCLQCGSRAYTYGPTAQDWDRIQEEVNPTRRGNNRGPSRMLGGKWMRMDGPTKRKSQARPGALLLRHSRGIENAGYHKHGLS